ncbi:hypothetical protein Tco_0325079 [Tanacetum coccineum]
MLNGTSHTLLIRRYNFNASVSNNSSTAGFTFFTANADVLTGSDCTQLVKKNDIPSPCEFPTEILSFKGKTHIFLFHYNPSCAKVKVDFFFDDILDKLLQIAGPSEVSKDTTGLLNHQDTYRAIATGDTSEATYM